MGNSSSSLSGRQAATTEAGTGTGTGTETGQGTGTAALLTQVTEFTPMYVPHKKPPYYYDDRLLIVMETKYTNYWYVLQLLHGIIDALHDLLTARYAGISTSDPKYNAEIRGLAALINGEGEKALPTHTKLASQMSVDALKKLLDITTTDPTDETKGIIWMIMQNLAPGSVYANAVPKLPKVHKALISHATAGINRPTDVNVITVYNIAGIILKKFTSGKYIGHTNYEAFCTEVVSHRNILQKADETTAAGNHVSDCGPGEIHRAMTAATERDSLGNLTLTDRGESVHPTSGTIDSSTSSGDTMAGAEWCVPFIFIYSENSDADKSKYFKLPSAVIMIYVKGTGETEAIISFKYFNIDLTVTKTLQSEMIRINNLCYDNPPDTPAPTRPGFDSNEWITDRIKHVPPLSDVITFIQGGNSWIKDFFLKFLKNKKTAVNRCDVFVVIANLLWDKLSDEEKKYWSNNKVKFIHAFLMCIKKYGDISRLIDSELNYYLNDKNTITATCDSFAANLACLANLCVLFYCSYHKLILQNALHIARTAAGTGEAPSLAPAPAPGEAAQAAAAAAAAAEAAAAEAAAEEAKINAAIIAEQKERAARAARTDANKKAIEIKGVFASYDKNNIHMDMLIFLSDLFNPISGISKITLPDNLDDNIDTTRSSQRVKIGILSTITDTKFDFQTLKISSSTDEPLYNSAITYSFDELYTLWKIDKTAQEAFIVIQEHKPSATHDDPYFNTLQACIGFMNFLFKPINTSGFFLVDTIKTMFSPIFSRILGKNNDELYPFILELMKSGKFNISTAMVKTINEYFTTIVSFSDVRRGIVDPITRFRDDLKAKTTATITMDPSPNDRASYALLDPMGSAVYMGGQSGGGLKSYDEFIALYVAIITEMQNYWYYGVFDLISNSNSDTSYEKYNEVLSNLRITLFMWLYKNKADEDDLFVHPPLPPPPSQDEMEVVVEEDDNGSEDEDDNGNDNGNGNNKLHNKIEKFMQFVKTKYDTKEYNADGIDDMTKFDMVGIFGYPHVVNGYENDLVENGNPPAGEGVKRSNEGVKLNGSAFSPGSHYNRNENLSHENLSHENLSQLRENEEGPTKFSWPRNAPPFSPEQEVTATHIAFSTPATGRIVTRQDQEPEWRDETFSNEYTPPLRILSYQIGGPHKYVNEKRERLRLRYNKVNAIMTGKSLRDFDSSIQNRGLFRKSKLAQALANTDASVIEQENGRPLTGANLFGGPHNEEVRQALLNPDLNGSVSNLQNEYDAVLRERQQKEWERWQKELEREYYEEEEEEDEEEDEDEEDEEEDEDGGGSSKAKTASTSSTATAISSAAADIPPPLPTGVAEGPGKEKKKRKEPLSSPSERPFSRARSDIHPGILYANLAPPQGPVITRSQSDPTTHHRDDRMDIEQSGPGGKRKQTRKRSSKKSKKSKKTKKVKRMKKGKQTMKKNKGKKGKKTSRKKR